MTIEEKIRQLLSEHGMWSTGLEETMREAKEGDLLESMAQRWGDSLDDYPPQFLAVLWLCVRGIALDWVDANCPKAFYRPLLASEADQPQAQPAPGSTLDCTAVPVAEFGYVIDAPEVD